MRAWNVVVVVVLVAACKEAADNASVPDAPVLPDAQLPPPLLCSETEPLLLNVVDLASAPPRSTCVPADGGFPAECVKPDGVTWVEPLFEGARQTVPLPAGAYFEDPVAGCMWFVVWPEADGYFRIETAALGCSVAFVVPDALTESSCGRTSYIGRGCTTIGLFHESCYSASRGVAASGGAYAQVDGVAGTLTTSGLPSDTSSSPHSCACE